MSFSKTVKPAQVLPTEMPFGVPERKPGVANMRSADAPKSLGGSQGPCFSCGTGTYCRVWKMVFNVFLLDVASFRFQLNFSDNERYAGNGLVEFELCMQQCSADA